MSENAPIARSGRVRNGVILVFGLAGAGKSTLAKGLSKQLGLRLIHPSGIIRDLLACREPDIGSTVANDGYWESDKGFKQLRDRLREETPVDVRVHEILLREVERGNVVIDTWSLPWLSEAGFRIKLEAPLSVRAVRAAGRAGISYGEALSRIAQKDQDTRELFLRLHGFDIMRDLAHFDLVLDTDETGAEEILRRSVEAWVDDKPS